MKITVAAKIHAPISEIWEAWTTPEDIMHWHIASDNWQTTSAIVELKEGGSFSWRMEAMDGSSGFDFSGTYTEIEEHKHIEYRLEDGRIVLVEFIGDGHGVIVQKTFDIDSGMTPEQQREGWQTIVDRFARHVEIKG